LTDLRRELEQALQGRTWFLGLGNVDYGDDGFGVRLAERLIEGGLKDVGVAGTSPERWIGRLADASFDHVVFLDAVELGLAPGSAVFLDAAEIAARYPQISTHKISLEVLARWVESKGRTKAWLLGVQVESLRTGQQLSDCLQKSLSVLGEMLLGVPESTGAEVDR
jgi:hydrogenase maturation protease